MSAPQPILHVITSLNLGGAETMMVQVLEHTDRTRFTPHVVSLRPEAPLADRVRRAGIEPHFLDMRSYAQMPAALAKLKRIMREVRPALVQTWMYHADLLGGIAARSLTPRPPVVWNIQGSNLDPRGTKFLSRVVCRLCGAVSRTLPDKIAVCSLTAMDVHERLGYDRSRMIHIVNGADTARFVPDANARRELRAELGIPQDAFVIGMAGRNDPQKDYPNYFAAIREMQQRDPDVHFIACGAGVTADDPALARLRASCPRPDHIHLIGPRRDMPRVYPAFDLKTLTSAFGEGLPLSLTEAMACGVPGVATDVGDSAATIGDCGAAVPIGDPSALVREWRKILRLTPDQRAALSRAARLRAEKCYALPAITERYERLYNDLINDAGKSFAARQPTATLTPVATAR
jgi:glycosyltransferase involved in cell wall biosynthesis